MSTMSIRNPETDAHASELVTKVFETLTPHWKSLLPKVEVVVSKIPFNQVPELSEFCETQNSRPEFRMAFWQSLRSICPQFHENEAIIWVYYNQESLESSGDYDFQKELCSTIAQLIWDTSPRFRLEVAKEITGTEQGAFCVTFRDSFSRFFLNPAHLRKKKHPTWVVFKRLDETFQGIRSRP